MIKKVNIFLILFIFLFGFAGGAFLMNLKNTEIIIQQKREIEWCRNGSDFDAMMLEVYHDRLFGEKDSIQ